MTKKYKDFDWKNRYRQLYLNFYQDSNSFMNFYVKFRQYIFRFEYLKKFRDQLKMINVLLDKVFFQLKIIYDNLLKSLKTLKEIKIYFIHENNSHKMTRKTHEKEKIQKIDKAVRLSTSKQFVSIFFPINLHIFAFCFVSSYNRLLKAKKYW